MYLHNTQGAIFPDGKSLGVYGAHIYLGGIIHDNSELYKDSYALAHVERE